MLIMIFLWLLLGFERPSKSKRNIIQIFNNEIKNYPNAEFKKELASKKIGLILGNKNLFDEFNRTYVGENYNNLFYFENENEIYKYNEEKRYEERIECLIELFILKNNYFNFKIKNDNINLKKLISDEKSDLNLGN